MIQLAYWIGFVVYSVIVILIGWLSYRRQERAPDPDVDFWAAGRKLNAWQVGLSISASFMSISWSCVYTVQLFYWYGIGALWLVPIPWLLTMVGYFVLAPRFRKLPAFSQPEMVANQFGERARVLLALPITFVFLVWGGAEIFAAANVLSPLMKAPFHLVLALVALVVAIYSTMGGFAAVVSTDRVQFFLVGFFIVTIAAVAGDAVSSRETLAAALQKLPAAPKSGMSALAVFAAGPALIIMTLIAYLPGWVVETDIWLRLQAARSTKAARLGVLISGVNSMLFLALFPMVIGLCALYLYPPVAGQIPTALYDGARIFAVLMRDHVPLALSVLLSVGLCAAAMSTIDTCGNVVALSLSYDLLEPFLRRRNGNVDRRRVARYMSAGAIVLAYLYAIFTDSLWDIFYLSSGILTTTLFIPMIALFRPKATPSQVHAAALAGFVGTLVFYFFESRGLLATLEPDWLAATGLGYILWGMAASFAAYQVPRFRSLR